MRHSRRRVMKEHYKLYMRKHILNGRYFQRNLQVVMCMVLVVALTVGCVTVGKTIGSSDGSNHEVSVKEALFGNNESNTKSVAKDTEEATETVVASEDTETTTATEATTTEAVAVLTGTTEAATEEPTEEPSLFDDRCIANVEDTLNIRQEPNTDSEFVGSMESGAIAIVEGTEGEWTKIKSGDVEGYVLTQYILTGAVAEAFAKDYVILHGTVLEDGVNVRAEKSTQADIVTILDKDAVVTVLEDPNAEDSTDSGVVATTEQASESTTTENTTTVDTSAEASTEAAIKTEEATPSAEAVTGESADEDINWMQIRLEDGQEGYVSADYISVDELYQVAVSKEELERKAAEEEAARKAAEEEAARQAAAEEAARKAANTKKTIGSVSSGNGGSYKGASIAPITAAQAGESLGTFTITGYCGCAKCSGGSNRTATGTIPTQGRTIAADPSVLPYGTQVVIGGVVYTVEDCGSGVNGNHIDIFFATHEQALAFGRRSMQVFKY